MSYAIFVRNPDGTITPLPERFRTPADAKAAWGYVVMRRDVRPQYIESVRDEVRA